MRTNWKGIDMQRKRLKNLWSWEKKESQFWNLSIVEHFHQATGYWTEQCCWGAWAGETETGKLQTMIAQSWEWERIFSDLCNKSILMIQSRDFKFMLVTDTSMNSVFVKTEIFPHQEIWETGTLCIFYSCIFIIIFILQ